MSKKSVRHNNLSSKGKKYESSEESSEEYSKTTTKKKIVIDDSSEDYMRDNYRKTTKKKLSKDNSSEVCEKKKLTKDDSSEDYYVKLTKTKSLNNDSSEDDSEDYSRKTSKKKSLKDDQSGDDSEYDSSEDCPRKTTKKKSPNDSNKDYSRKKTKKKSPKDDSSGDDSENNYQDPVCNLSEDESEESKQIKRVKKNSEIYDSDDIRNIIFEDINDDYAYGKLGPFDVMMMKKNGFINATKLCNDAGKRFKNWLENKSSKELIEGVNAQSGQNSARNEIGKGKNNPSVIMITTGKKITQGTYIHTDLIIHVASWCSVDYATKVSKIVKEFHIKEFDQKMKKIIAKKDCALAEKDDKITNLENLIKQMRKQQERAERKTDNVLKDTGKIIKQNTGLKKAVNKLDSKLDTACYHRVVNTDHKSNNMLIIFKNNDVLKKKSKEVLYQYSARRLMNKNYKQLIKDHKVEHPNAIIIYEIDYSPNSVILWKNIRAKLSDKLEINGCNFNLKKNYTEKKLMKDIVLIHDERLNKENI